MIFLVATEEQLRAARAVARHLRGASVIDPYAGHAGPLDESVTVTRPVGFTATPAAIARAHRLVGRALARETGGAPVLVVGQDVGLIERATIAAARRRGATVVLMPDGIVAYKRSDRRWGRSPRTLAADAADRALGGDRVLSGRRGEFGSAGPRYVLSWGPAWSGTWRERCPGAEIVDAGCPRTDGYSELPPPPGDGRVLICSQPLLLPQTAALASQADEWYRWLARVNASPHERVRIRLHPGERAVGYHLPHGLEVLVRESPAPLLDDLRWSDTVVAPFSSVLVEALAAGRVPITAGGTAAWGAFADNAFLADPRLGTIDFRSGPSAKELAVRADELAAGPNHLREDFLSHFGRSAQRTGAVLRELVR